MNGFLTNLVILNLIVLAAALLEAAVRITIEDWQQRNRSH